MNFFARIWFAAVFPFLNRYDATQWSPDRSWRMSPLQDARLDLTKATREVLQSKSRDWESASCLYTKLADLWEQYTVGTGIQFTSASSDPEWNKAADEAWERWKPMADIQSRFGFDNLQGVITRAMFIDGEIFVLLITEGPFPRIQLVEAHNCKTPDQHASREGKSIVDGIEIDPRGRPTAYWFRSGDTFNKIDATAVVHVFEPARPGQYRGVPYCAAALNILHDLHDLQLLEMKANKDAAEYSTFFKTATGEMSAMQSMAQRFKSVGTAQGTSSSATEQRREYYQNATGGKNVVLFHGDEVQQHVPERPGANTREYWRLLAGEVCACSGQPLCLVYPDSMQGTVYRGALDAAAAFYRCKTGVLATHFKRIRNHAIEIEARTDKRLAGRPKDWQKISNGTVRAPNVDIGRNSAAMLAEIKAGTRTFTSAAAELGLDGKQLLAEKAAEAKYIRSELAKDGVMPTDVSDLLTEEPPQPATPPQE